MVLNTKVQRFRERQKQQKLKCPEAFRVDMINQVQIQSKNQCI